MASNLDFVQYVAWQIAFSGDVTYKKMFGEYGVYLDGKMVALVCDNQFMVKPTKTGKLLLEENGGAIEQLPYKGAVTPCFLIEDLEDKEFLAALLRATYDELSLPKLKKGK